MKCDRVEVLKNYLRCEDLIERTNLTVEELRVVTFSKNSGDLLVEAVKKLIFSYCNEDSSPKILRNINQRIKEMEGNAKSVKE